MRSHNGMDGARAQSVYSYAGQTLSRLRVVLSWDSPGTDMYLHVVTPVGGHVGTAVA